MPNVEPPNWVLKKIHEIYPKARLGYIGGPKYALCELWRVREDSVIGAEFAGHVYGPRYDKAFYHAKHITDVSIDEVFSGKITEVIRGMLTSFKERQLKRLREAGKVEDDQIKELAAEQGHDLYMKGMRSYHRPKVVAKKFLRKEDREILTGEAADRHNIADSYLPPPNAPVQAIK